MVIIYFVWYKKGNNFYIIKKSVGNSKMKLVQLMNIGHMVVVIKEVLT